MKLTAFAAALLLCSTAVAQAPAAEAPKPPQFTFALHGFVSVSGAYQDGTYFLSEGQQAIAAGTEPAADKNSLTFDVRQSRFNFSVKGPQVMFGATPSAVLEIDFFQGFGAGNYGDVSLLNRLRLAYSELNWGAHRLIFGQTNDLIFAMAPNSLSHIAFPLGYFTGNLGWRRPGIFGFHTFPVAKDFKLEAAWEVGRAQWADAAASTGAGTVNPTGPTASGITQGEASVIPAVEGRVTLTHKIFSAFVAGHYNQVDLTGVGFGGPNPTINVTSAHVGAKLTYPLPNAMAITAAATGFAGKNVEPLIGNFAEFKLRGGYGGVSTYGYWAQVGLNLTKEFSLWGLYGMQKPNEDQAKAAAFTRLENKTTNVIAQYRDGGFGLSAEWINFNTKIATYTGTAPALTFASSKDQKANQYMLTATYFF